MIGGFLGSFEVGKETVGKRGRGGVNERVFAFDLKGKIRTNKGKG